MGRSQKENEHRLALHPAAPRAGAGRPAAADVPRGGLRRALRRRRRRAARARRRRAHPRAAGRRVRRHPAAQAAARATWPSCARARCCGAGRTACRTRSSPSWPIDRRLTLIAFEAMNHWKRDGSFNLHVFHKNNELAGYCSVLHAHAARRARPATTAAGCGAVVIGFGATARGAVTALTALGVRRRRRPDPPAGGRGRPRRSTPRGSCTSTPTTPTAPGQPRRHARRAGCRWRSSSAEHDIIVNCVLQDTDAPLMFLTDDDLPSCSRRARWSSTCRATRAWASAGPGPRRSPTRRSRSADNVLYYAVDHSPSYLWSSATWEISEALLPFLRTVLDGPGRLGRRCRPIRRAIEIRDGVIQNPAILSFQGRSPDYPHEVLPA